MTIYAKGLRNTIGFGWHPETGELWGMDHGIDWLGDNEQKEELNLIKQDANYGWRMFTEKGNTIRVIALPATPRTSSICKQLPFPP